MVSHFLVSLEERLPCAYAGRAAASLGIICCVFRNPYVEWRRIKDHDIARPTSTKTEVRSLESRLTRRESNYGGIFVCRRRYHPKARHDRHPGVICVSDQLFFIFPTQV